MSVRVTPKGSTTGLKSVTKLHASTFVDGRIEVAFLPLLATT